MNDANAAGQVLVRGILRVRIPLILLLAAGSIAAMRSVASLPVDMSFRPLFSNDPDALAATQAFEAEFGQESGAHIGVVLETPDVFTDDFVAFVHELSAATLKLQHVTDVVSLTDVHVPQWTGDEILVQRWPREDLDYAQAARTLRIFAQAQPQAVHNLLSDDFTSTVLWARLDLPLSDLDARRKVIARFSVVVNERLPPNVTARLVGVSVVEAAYAEIVWRSLATSVGLTVALVVAALAFVFGSARAVVVAMSGVTVAVPMTLAIMERLGQSLTIVNSMVPTLVLVVGVADALHMLLAYRELRSEGRSVCDANQSMFGRLLLPCLMTTVTTTAGFLSLHLASLAAIRDFGLNVAIGVTLVFILNMILVPVLIDMLGPRIRTRRTRFDHAALGPLNRWVELVTGHPALVALSTALLFVAAASTIPGLVVQQRFNEELAPDHPVREAQTILEARFGGILGPEIRIARADGTPLTDPDMTERLHGFCNALVSHDAVRSVRSHLDLLPVGASAENVPAILDLREGPLRYFARSVLNADATTAGIIVRTADMGSKEALRFADDIRALADEQLGDEFDAQIVGQWWLAQVGMSQLLRDMLVSFATATLVVIPILAFVVRRWSLFLVSVIGNVLPMLFALGVMAALGISLRIGTAMILAIALGIAIDDTIHVLVRFRREDQQGDDAPRGVRTALRSAGCAVLYTSVILVIGFGSMGTSSLLAIRDMGLIGASTFLAALLADLALVPAVYLLVSGRPSPSP